MGRWWWLRISRPPWNHFFKKWVSSSRQESEKCMWIPRNWNRVLVPRVHPYIRPVPGGGGGVMRLRLGRRLVNLSPLAQHTMNLTNGDAGTTKNVGRGFESDVHHEIALQRKVSFLMSRIWKILLDPQKCEPRVVARRPVKSGLFQGGRVLWGLDWIDNQLTFYL